VPVVDSETIRVRLHPKQLVAYQSTSRVIAFIGGLQSGKSTVGGLWFAKQVALHDSSPNTFLVCSPTYKIMEQSILPWILRLFHGAGHYKGSDDAIHLNGGGVIYLRSLTDPDCIEGIARVRSIWTDEAGLISYRAWSNLLGRSAFCRAPIMLTTTPYSQNFLYRDIYLPYVKGQIKEPDCTVVTCNSSDNPYFDKGELERQRKLMDSRIYRMKYEAKFEKLVGLVYPDFDLGTNTIESHKIPRDRYTIVGGVDPGFNDPFAICVCAIANDGKQVIIFAEFYKQYVSHSDRINVLKDFQARYGITQYYCDSSTPADIDMMVSANLPVVAVEKGPGSVMSGISYVTSLIRDKRLRVMAGTCPHFIEEINLYSYPETQLDVEGRGTEKPIGMHDHCFVAGTSIYTSTGTRSIETILPGDLVLTRSGYQPVLCNQSRQALVVSYLGLIGTDDHPIYTNRGFVPACELMPCDIYYGLEDIWSKLLNISVRSITGIPIALIGLISLISGVAVIICTIWFILLQTARYLRDLSYTILMRILETIGLRTLNSCQKQPIVNSTCMTIPVSNHQSIWNILKGSARLLKSGMDPKRVINGIRTISKKCGISCMQEFRRCAIIVNNRTKLFQGRVNTALTNASQRLVAVVVSITLRRHVIAEKHSSQININPTKPVLGNVQENCVVYNLTVTNSPEYFANGILVHNCMDACRYALISNRHIIDKWTETTFVPAKTHLQRLLAGEFEGHGPKSVEGDEWYDT
jgi:PBSX family phage terminase large subunit